VGYHELRLDEVLGKSAKRVGLTALLVRVCEGGIAALILLAWRGKRMSRQTSDGLRLALALQIRQWDWGQT